MLDFSLCVVISDTGVGERTFVGWVEANLKVINRVLTNCLMLHLNVHHDLLLEYFPRVLL